MRHTLSPARVSMAHRSRVAKGVVRDDRDGRVGGRCREGHPQEDGDGRVGARRHADGALHGFLLGQRRTMSQAFALALQDSWDKRDSPATQRACWQCSSRSCLQGKAHGKGVMGESKDRRESPEPRCLTLERKRGAITAVGEENEGVFILGHDFVALLEVDTLPHVLGGLGWVGEGGGGGDTKRKRQHESAEQAGGEREALTAAG